MHGLAIAHAKQCGIEWREEGAQRFVRACNKNGAWRDADNAALLLPGMQLVAVDGEDVTEQASARNSPTPTSRGQTWRADAVYTFPVTSSFSSFSSRPQVPDPSFSPSSATGKS
eukprot:SAG11_NODE_4299_length_1964_cov_1.131367_2_plen_114_part_00